MYSNDLYHHGILGQKWGLRRFQPYPKGYNGPGKTIGEASKKIKKVLKNTSDALGIARSKEQIANDKARVGENTYAILTKLYGKSGVNRISHYMDAGKNIQEAMKMEDDNKESLRVGAAAGTAILSASAAFNLIPKIPVILATASSKLLTPENIQRGQQFLQSIITPEMLQSIITPEMINASSVISQSIVSPELIEAVTIEMANNPELINNIKR